MYKKGANLYFINYIYYYMILIGYLLKTYYIFFFFPTHRNNIIITFVTLSLKKYIEIFKYSKDEEAQFFRRPLYFKSVHY